MIQRRKERKTKNKTKQVLFFSFFSVFFPNKQLTREGREREGGGGRLRREDRLTSLPGGGPSQQLETRLRVPGEDDVLGRAKDPVAQHHLQIKGKLGGDPEESPGVWVGCPHVDDGEGIGVENHQGKEVANEVFSQAWLAAETTSNSHLIAFVFINQVGAEGGVGFLSLVVFLSFVGISGSGCHGSSLLSGSPLVGGGSYFGVHLSS